MDNRIIDDQMNTDLNVSTEGKNYLVETKKWTKFLAILGFIFAGLVAVAAVAAGAFLGADPPLAQLGIPSALITVLYLGIGVLIFFPALYLFKFSDHMTSSLETMNQGELTSALKNLKSYFKFYAVMSIIGLSLYVLIFLVAIVGGLVS